MIKRWHAVAITVPQAEGDFATALLHEIGCTGAVEKPDTRRGGAHLTAYFDAASVRRPTLKRRIRQAFAPFPSLANTRTYITTQRMEDWSVGWRQWFRPFAIVPGVVVSPSWERYSPREGESVITLDPGMAFGTGLHPTTQLCARAIRDAAQDGARSLLDVGTGSGLLALVGHRLNMDRIVAVDIDKDACKVARENFAINNARDINTVSSLSRVKSTFDIVAANILLLILLKLKEDLIRRTRRGGRLILSGITPDQEDSIRSEFSLRTASTWRQDGWSLMTFVRKD
jgi:ribosomal protein L11 methyltransferase